MDTRPFRLPFPSSLKYFELDLPPVIAFKHSLFFSPPTAISTPLHPISLIECDLMQSEWMQNLESHGFDPNFPTLWILEGLVMYLTEKTVSQLLTEISSLSASGSHILLHTVNTLEIAESASFNHNNPNLDILSNLSSKMTFGVDVPSTLLDAIGGWDEVDTWDYLRIAKWLNCEKYLVDLKTNSAFTTAVYRNNYQFVIPFLSFPIRLSAAYFSSYIS
jgi:methyltransferase (TIGR00027 family)